MAWSHRPEGGTQSFFLFDAGGVAALALSGQRIDVYVPDLETRLVRGQPIPVSADKFGVSSVALEIRQNTRLVVRGDVVHIVRSTEAGVSVAAVEIEREGLPRWRSLDPVVWHPTQTAFGATVGTSTTGKRPWRQPIAISWRATLEGCWVLSTFNNPDGEENPGRATWYEPLRDDKLTPFVTKGNASSPERAGIVTVGSVALVPTERGFLRIPLAPIVGGR